jgi:CubicO group peptidase (beta-lactamase class C family)
MAFLSIAATVFSFIFSGVYLVNTPVMKRCLLVFSCLLFSGAGLLLAQSVGRSIAPEKVIDSLLADYSGDNPGASVLVIQNGKAVYAKGFGLADLERKKHVKPATNFRLASFTKQFTAMCIMILEEQHRLSVSDSLTKYFPNFPAWAQGITIRQLLTHTSGIIDYESLIADSVTAPVSDADVISLLSSCDSVYFKPGEKFAYSNSAYVLLGAIVERVSGQRFKEFLSAHIFQPLKMRRSTVNGLHAKIRNRAYGYTKNKAGIQKTDQSVTSYTLGDGGIYSSIDDLFKWDQALYTTKLVTAATLEKIYTIQANIPSGARPAGGYGYGWFIREQKGDKWVFHSGGSRGFSTWIERNPAKQFSVILLVNRSGQNLDLLAEKIKALYGY